MLIDYHCFKGRNGLGPWQMQVFQAPTTLGMLQLSVMVAESRRDHQIPCSCRLLEMAMLGPNSTKAAALLAAELALQPLGWSLKF